MPHPPSPTYYVPRADDPIPDPGGWWRCVLVLALGGTTILVGIGGLVDTLIHHDLAGSVQKLVFNTELRFTGAVVLPCLAIIPINLIASVCTLHAWYRPTGTTVARATRWVKRLRTAIGWALLAGMTLTLWITAWSLVHYRVR
jgi:hypothetical protein